MDKTVIFVVGTSYSGSTFLDMSLAALGNGVSCGEIYALLYPTRKNHIRVINKILKDPMNFWNPILLDYRKGISIYDSIFKRTGTSYIVDSSKSILWVAKKRKELLKNGYEIKILLTYKKPLALAKSYIKRGKENEWQAAWVGYHSQLLQYFGDFETIDADAFKTDSEVIVKAAKKLGIDLDSGGKGFKPQTLFGNASARVHLPKDVFNSSDNVSEIIKEQNQKGKIDSKEIAQIEEIIQKDSRFEEIQNTFKIKGSNSALSFKDRIMFFYRFNLKSAIFKLKYRKFIHEEN